MLPKWTTRSFVRTGNEQNKICPPEDCRSGGIRRRLPKLRGQDSNLRPSGYEPDTLPSALPRDIYLAGAPAKSVKKRYWTEIEGLEPTTLRLTFLYRPVHKRAARRGWDSNPCAPKDKRISRPPRYDRFDTSPNIGTPDYP